MTDATVQAIVTSTPGILVALATFWNVWNVNRVHKAVNSTAAALAVIAKEKDAKLAQIEAENATLKEALRGKDTIAAVIAGQPK